MRRYYLPQDLTNEKKLPIDLWENLLRTGATSYQAQRREQAWCF